MLHSAFKPFSESIYTYSASPCSRYWNSQCPQQAIAVQFIIFVGGTLLLYLSCSCADNLIRRRCCLRYCRSSCRGWSFFEDSCECQESLVHQFFFLNFKLLRSSKLVHTLVMSQITYSRHAALAAWCVPQKHLHFMWQNLVQLCMIVHWSFQQHELLAADLVWTVRNLIFVVDAQIEIVIYKLFITQGPQPPITTIGKTYMGIKDGVLSI